MEDSAFLAAEASGVEGLRAAVEPFTADVVARRADIDAHDLVRAARTFASADRGYAVATTGPNMSGPGTLVEYLVLALNTICGRWLRAGERIPAPLTVQASMPPKAQAMPPFPAHGLGEPLPVTGLHRSLAGLPTAALPAEILDGGENRIRALISVAGNPLVAWPDQLKTIKALQALDLLVQIDVRMSATAKYADYVVAPTMSLEEPSVTAIQEVVSFYAAAYMGFPLPWAQWTDAVAKPPEGSDLIAEWEFFYGLGQRLGVTLDVGPVFDFLSAQRIPLDMTDKPTTAQVLELIATGSRIPLKEVRRHPRGALFPDPPVFVEPKDPGCTDRLHVGNAEMMADLATLALPLTHDQPSADGFDFRLISRRMRQAYNSSVHDIGAIRGRPFNPAFMNPEDLAQLGLHDGDLVEISSHTASIPGVVSADFQCAGINRHGEGDEKALHRKGSAPRWP